MALISGSDLWTYLKGLSRGLAGSIGVSVEPLYHFLDPLFPPVGVQEHFAYVDAD